MLSPGGRTAPAGPHSPAVLQAFWIGVLPGEAVPGAAAVQVLALQANVLFVTKCLVRK